MRLIDADTLIEKCGDWYTEEGSEEGYIGTIKGIVDTMPTIEPERKKGKWNCGDDMFEYAICSSCKWDSGEAWEYALKNFKFCPNCGAQMMPSNAKSMPSY